MAIITELEGRSWKGYLEENGIKVECRNASINATTPVIEAYEIIFILQDGGNGNPIHIGNATLSKNGFNLSISKADKKAEVLTALANLEAGLISIYTQV